MTGSAKKSNISRQQLRQQFDRKTWRRCSSCNGKGLVVGMFSNSPKAACVACNAAGWIPPDGEPLAEYEALLFLRRHLDFKAFQVADYRRRIAAGEWSPAGPADHYRGPGYKGD